MQDSIHAGHRQRLKNRFINSGLEDFENHNALELLLFYSIPRIDTNPIAHELIQHFGSISAVFDAPVNELIKVKNITENTASLIKLVTSLNKLYLEDKHTLDTIDSLETAGEYVKNKFFGLTNEVFLAVFLNNVGRVLGTAFLSEGTVNAVHISTRKIIEAAIKYQATAVIVAHNHPKGFALPSADDVSTTEALINALQTIDVSLIDHCIIGEDNEYISMASSSQYSSLFQ